MNELNYAKEVIKSSPDFDGYFILKGNKSNILTSLIYVTDAKIVTYDARFERKINDQKNYFLIDLNKRKRTVPQQ